MIVPPRQTIGYNEATGKAIRYRGNNGKAGVLTLVDRKARYLLVQKVAKRTSLEVTKYLNHAIEQWPGLILSITPDRGKEFANVQSSPKKKLFTFIFQIPIPLGNAEPLKIPMVY